MPHEIAWLKKIANRMKSNNVTQPLGVGGKQIPDAEYYDEFSDIHLTHIYHINPDNAEKYEEKIKNYMQYPPKNAANPLLFQNVAGELLMIKNAWN